MSPLSYFMNTQLAMRCFIALFGFDPILNKNYKLFLTKAISWNGRISKFGMAIILSFHLTSLTESMSVFQLRVDVGNKTGDESLAISRFRFIIANKMALMVLACGYGRIHSTKKTFPEHSMSYIHRTQKQKQKTL